MNMKTEEDKGEIVIYRTDDGKGALEVNLFGDSLWLNLNQMARLFERDKSVVSRHLNNIFKTKELRRNSVVAFFATTAAELYPSVEEKAANLLYFLIKDHPFVDGNKRIASLLFIWFLEKNNFLSAPDGERKINDNALVALTLLVAESNPKQKDVMIKLIINLITGHR